MAGSSLETVIPTLNHAELELLSDSSSSSNWAMYGLVQLEMGWPQKTKYALERADQCETPSPIMFRLHATYSWLQGDVQRALEYLAKDSTDFYSQVILTVYLQENYDLIEADSIISYMYPQCQFQQELVSFLTARQLRFNGNPNHARELLDEIVQADTTGILRTLSYIELLLNHEAEETDIPLISCIKADLNLLGGVYLDPLLSYLNKFRMDSKALLARSIILSILDQHNEAAQLIPSNKDTLISPELSLWRIELLLHLDKLNEAMDEVTTILLQDSSNSRAFELKGIILMRGERYTEAFHLMQEAWVRTGSYGCIALQGLAAELTGNSRLAVECYSILLGCHADSIVLINRCRDIVLNNDSQSYIYFEDASFADNSSSDLYGNARLRYYDNVGEYNNRSFSLSTNLYYRYGLYGSNIAASGRYTLKRWPDSDRDYTLLTTSLAASNYSTSRFFQRYILDWEKRRFSIDRNRFDVIAGLGYRFTPIHSLEFTPFLGFGRSQERLNPDVGETDHWIVVSEMRVEFRGSTILSVVPCIELSGQATINLDKLTGYELTMSALIDLFSHGFYSFSLGYETEQSYLPESDYYCMNRCTYIMITLKFE